MRTPVSGRARSNADSRPFSLGLYLMIVCAFSWPFQLAFVFLGESFRPILLLSMIMAGVGTLVAGRFVFRDGFDGAGWRVGRPSHYAAALGLTLLLWLFPVVIENALGIRTLPDTPPWSSIAMSFAGSFAITLLPAFGEEFSWRGYRRPEVSVPLVLAVSLIPTVMHAIVFAYLWSVSGSLLVATVYHSAFDEVRDTLQQAVGFGALAENWQAVVLTTLGALLLWKVSWTTGRS